MIRDGRAPSPESASFLLCKRMRAISSDAWRASSPSDRARLILDALLERHAEAIAQHPQWADRLRSHVPDFWAAYSAVYGQEATHLDWVARIFDAALHGFRNRSAPLRTIDTTRPDDWLQHPETVGIMLYVDRFADTLDGVRKRLDYLHELGVTYVHLMPLLQPRPEPNDGGYAVADYRAVDPRLGTMDDLRALATALHERGMTLAVDVVMNHTAREHPWAQRALDGDARYQNLYWMFPDRTEPDQWEQTLPEVFPDFAPGNFTWVDALDRWVWTSFYEFQWDLNYANPDVFLHMLREMLFLANVGVDVLRLDAVPFLWKRKGTHCRNEPEAHWLLQAYRAVMNVAAPGVLFKAEAIVAPDDVVRYLGAEADRDECDTAYNAALMCHLWHALACGNVRLLQTMLAHLPEAPKHTAWLNYVRAHDDIGWGISDADAARVGQEGHDTRLFCADYYAGRWPGSVAEGYDFQPDPHTGEARTSGTTAALAGLQKARAEADPDAIDRAIRRILLLHGIVFAMRGFPQLYSGDEIGLLNDFSYLTDDARARDNRWMHRPPMDWEKAARRHEPGCVEYRLFQGLQQQAHTRKTLAAFHGAASQTILHTPNDALFVVERGTGAQRVLLVANLSDAAQALPIGSLPPSWRVSAYRDALTDTTHRFAARTLLVPPYGVRWYQPAPTPEEAPLQPTPITVEVPTAWGEMVYLTGAIEHVGSTSAEAVGPLSPHDYPRWTIEHPFPAGTWCTAQWIVRRDGETVRRSPHRLVLSAGRGVVATLSE